VVVTQTRGILLKAEHPSVNVSENQVLRIRFAGTSAAHSFRDIHPGCVFASLVCSVSGCSHCSYRLALGFIFEWTTGLVADDRVARATRRSAGIRWHAERNGREVCGANCSPCLSHLLRLRCSSLLPQETFLSELIGRAVEDYSFFGNT